ncbi:MAG: hypothetical protein FKY71_14350 [Spiribacter salinus]|uniref:Uncharacterized protein n=1 Tax=Spiribacter salinus TaxID=1335746 RepID=A0A540VNJ9_9GAMM|nr:MAG: hypothetical protein FKY71_14350 [Spiribacter salinus]
MPLTTGFYWLVIGMSVFFIIDDVFYYAFAPFIALTAFIMEQTGQLELLEIETYRHYYQRAAEVFFGYDLAQAMHFGRDFNEFRSIAAGLMGFQIILTFFSMYFAPTTLVAIGVVAYYHIRVSQRAAYEANARRLV